MSDLNLRPLEDRVIIEPLEQEEVTAGGIFLPETAKEKPQQGKVLAVGQGKRDDKGNLIPLDVKVGDTVLFAKYAGTEVKLNGKKQQIMRVTDILAVVNPN
jgi:chaperonin GroES